MQLVDFSPPEITRRYRAAWDGIRVDAVQVVRNEPFEYGFRGEHHLLIACELAERHDGETAIDGLPKSSARNLTRKISFVPAGHQFHGWQKPRVPARVTYFYIDPRAPLLDPELRFAETEFRPLMFVFDRDIWETAMKLRAEAERAGPSLYAEALSRVLLHELLRFNGGTPQPAPVVRGGLAAWQRKRVAEYIEEHLDEDISVADLAGLARLSPFHFSRAFRQSFGLPPHRYHVGRRIERAKSILSDPSISVTELGLRLGFSETSAFTATFRKFTGRTPTDFRRMLE